MRSRNLWSGVVVASLFITACAPPMECTEAGCNGGNRTVTGRVTYDFVPAKVTGLDFAGAERRPVRGAIVRLIDGTTELASGTTADDGTYSFTFTPVDGALRVVAFAESTTPSIRIEDNTEQDAPWSISAAVSADSVVDLHATHGWLGDEYETAKRTAAPFAMLDTILTASRAFMAVRPVVFPLLKVNWSPDNVPQEGKEAAGDISATHYSLTDKEIYVLGSDGADTDEFDAHVIVRTWVHFFEDTLGRRDSRFERAGRGQTLDPRASFAEGLGTAVAALVLKDTTYVDTYWENGAIAAFGYDAEQVPTPTDDAAPGAFSEISMARALYDLCDDNADGAHDQVSVGLGGLYDVLTTHMKNTDALTTIAPFVVGLKAQPGANAAAIDAVLAHYNLGVITSDFGAGESTLTEMFTTATLPYTANHELTGGEPHSARAQHHYVVFTGTGRNVVVNITNDGHDLAVGIYQRGLLAWSDELIVGTETLTVPTVDGATYVVDVEGWSDRSGPYQAAVTIDSP